MEYSLKVKVRFFAFYSRLFVFALQFFADNLIEDNEELGSFRWIPDPSLPKVKSFGDEIVSFFLHGLNNLQAQLYLHVANNGYTYENTLIISPGYSLILRNIAQIIDNPWFHLTSTLKLSAFILNSCVFIFAAEAFYLLSRKILKDEYLAYKSALLFCVNPSSVIFSASYPESLYFLLSTAGWYSLETLGLGLLNGVIFAFATSFLDIGIINVAFVLYASMKSVATKTILHIRNKKSKSDLTSTTKDLAINAFGPGVINAILVCVPLAASQWFAFSNFCTKNNYKYSKEIMNANKSYITPPKDSLTNVSEWCNDDPPISFFYVHKKYGAFDAYKIFDINQLPSLIIISPGLALLTWQIWIFYKYHRNYALRLGLIDNSLLGIPKPKSYPIIKSGSLPRESFVYIIHALVLTIFALIFYPLKYYTRILCSGSPVLYWIAAVSTTPSMGSLVPITTENPARKVESLSNLNSPHANILLQEKECSDVGNWVKIYFLGYFLLGTFLYSNNYSCA